MSAFFAPEAPGLQLLLGLAMPDSSYPLPDQWMPTLRNKCWKQDHHFRALDKFTCSILESVLAEVTDCSSVLWALFQDSNNC